MPGGRLTLRERRRIARGVADGLSYAEIARGLDRPTSTVTREVMRNGGPNGYRPERAQRETDRRARRGPSAQARAGAGGSPAAGDEALERAQALIVKALLASGLAKTPARVLTLLFLSDEGATAAELAGGLGVSPASVSKAVAYLEAQELLRRVRAPGERRERYVIDRLAWYRSWVAGIRANLGLAEATREGGRVLGAASPAGARLEDIASFLEAISEDMIRTAELWKRRLVGEHGTPDGDGAVAPPGADVPALPLAPPAPAAPADGAGGACGFCGCTAPAAPHDGRTRTPPGEGARAEG